MMTEALCRRIEEELELLPGEIEKRNTYATNQGFTGELWARNPVKRLRFEAAALDTFL